MYRRASLIFIALVVSLSTLLGFFVDTAYAAPPEPYIPDVIKNTARVSTDRNALAHCVYENFKEGSGAWPSERFANGEWFQGSDVRLWYNHKTSAWWGEGQSCKEFNLPEALKALGFTGGYFDTACKLGFTRYDQDESSNCVNGASLFEFKDISKQKILDNIDKVYKGKRYDNAQYYAMGMDLMLSNDACKAVPIATEAEATPEQKATSKYKVLNIVDGAGNEVKVLYEIKPDDGGAHWQFRNYADGSNGSYDYTCSDLVDEVINKYSADYAVWAKANGPGVAGNITTCDEYVKAQIAKGSTESSAELLKACNAGAENGTQEYCTSAYPTNSMVNKSALYNACMQGISITGSAQDDSEDGTTECNMGGLGWLICPAMNFMASVNDSAYGFLASYFLSVDPGMVDGAKGPWTKFRDLANVAFVIAIIFIIYSQITSLGINNYGIKKLLPKLVIAALLVNISFYICGLAVDLSNLAGYGITQFFENIPTNFGNQDLAGNSTLEAIGGGVTWAAVIGGALVAGVTVIMAVSTPVVIAALLAIGLIVLILIGRQAIIVLLIVVAPLAFVAYLLPNTEKWFQKWYKAFFTLLMLFPVIGLVFAASRLAANIIVNLDTASTGLQASIMQITALGVSAIPFFVVPGLLKGSLNAVGAVGSKLGGMASGATKKIGSRVNDSSKLGVLNRERKRFKDARRGIRNEKALAKKGLTGLSSRVIGGVGGSGKSWREQARINASNLEAEEHEKTIKNAGTSIAGLSFDDTMKLATGATKGTDAEREAAVRFIGANGNFEQRNQMLQSIGTMNKTMRKSATSAVRSKGDGAIYGNSTLGQLEGANEGDFKKQFGNMKSADIGNYLQGETTKRIEKGDMKTSVMTDGLTSGYVEKSFASATSTAEKQKFAEEVSRYHASEAASGLETNAKTSMERMMASSGVQSLPSQAPSPQNQGGVNPQPQTQPPQNQGGVNPQPQQPSPQPQPAPQPQPSPAPQPRHVMPPSTQNLSGSPQQSPQPKRAMPDPNSSNNSSNPPLPGL